MDGDQVLTLLDAPLGTSPSGGVPRRRRFAGLLRNHPRLHLTALLSAPMLWLVVLYIGSLAVLVLSSFWSTDSFTGTLIRNPTLANYQTLFTVPVYRDVALRTLLIAIGVTVIDAIIALPLAFFMAKVVRRRRWRYVLVIAVTMPLWASYLVKGYAWRIMFVDNGVVDWALAPLGLHGPGLGLPATVTALAYLWLPYMILPIYAGLERLPDSLLYASADLGAGAWRSFTSVVLPMLKPAIVAGSIFTFSLTLGDYIMVKIVGGSSQMFANIVYDNIGVAGNLPFAAAAAMFPIAVIVLYLVAIRRTGALANL